MARGTIVVVLAFVLLAGCSSRPADDGNLSTSATATAHSVSTAPPAPAPPIVGACTVTRTAANTALGYGVNPDAATGAKTACDFADVAAGNLSRFAYGLVEVHWQTQASETSIGLRVDGQCRPGDQPNVPGGNVCTVAKTLATSSPLVLLLTQDQFQRYGDDPMSAYVFTEGASVEHAFEVRISLFEKGPVPDTYTGFRLL